VFTYPDISPVAFTLGPLQVRWYGLMYLGGFAIAWLGMRARARHGRAPIDVVRVDDLVFYAALGVIIGGRLGYMLFYNLPTLVSDPLSIVAVWRGGMSFHGGFLGVLIAMALFARRVELPFFAVMDFIAPWVPPGLGLGRIGNFINGELWGKVARADAPWAVMVDGVPRHASQLYEAFLEGLVLFIVLWSYSRRPRPLMAVSGLFALCYGLFRIMIEFVRLPDAQLQYLAFGWLTMGQVLSLPMVLGGAFLIYFGYRRGVSSDAGKAR
jgi:phosphatidylglycerol---prolipoprotein diacylglyceryl transferase